MQTRRWTKVLDHLKTPKPGTFRPPTLRCVRCEQVLRLAALVLLHLGRNLSHAPSPEEENKTENTYSTL